MAESIAHSIICPTLIGRDAQRAAMMQLLQRAHHERGQTLLIAGEAGIGKSRLVTELVKQATQQTTALYTGRCFEMDSAVPCALLVELLRAYLTYDNATTLLQEVGPNGVELTKLLPELLAYLPATVTTARAPSITDPDKRRLFETLFHCFVHTAQPIILIVEDAHWCDPVSLDFLLFLARKVVAYPILLVITYRDDEVNALLGRTLASLDRERLAVELLLTRLTKVQTDAMLRAIFTLPRPTQEDFLDELYTLTEGNPFFIEEILKSCIATGDIFQVGGQWGRKLLSQLHIPRTVQVAVHQRIDQLTAPAQQLVKTASVIGQRFDFSLLQIISQHEEAAILALLKQLMVAQLVVEESDERFAFRHALTRQAVYFSLLARERRALHRAVAEALQAQPGNDARLPELAHHFYTAGDWDKTWHYARRAGERALTLYAPRAAIEHFTHALEAAQQSGQQSAHSDDLAPLLQARGKAYETLGEFEAARADFEQALALARTRHDQRAEWQSLLNLGFLWTSRNFALAAEQLQQALTVARDLNDPAILAQSLNRVGNWHVNTEHPHLGEQYHAEALAIFQSLNDQPGIAATLDLLAGATQLAGNPQSSRVYSEQATALFRQLGEQRGLTSCLSWVAIRGSVAVTTVTPSAPLLECIKAAEDALHLAREIQWRPGEAFAMIALGLAVGAQGDYGKAIALVTGAVNIAQEIDHRWDTFGYIVLGALHLELGSPALAQEVLEQSLAVSVEYNVPFSLCMSSAFLAATYLAQHKIDKAKAVLANAFGDATNRFPAPGEPPPTMAQRHYWRVSAEIALAEGRAADALAIAEHLLATSGQYGTNPINAVPALVKLRGDALRALNRTAEAIEFLVYAQQAATLQGMRSLLWRIHQTLGHLYKQQGARSEAEAHFASARSLIDEIAQTLPTPQLHDSFMQSAFAHLPAPATLTPLRARKQSVDGLTARECEVAILVHQGKSDREIADTLSLSTRTVGTHVSNILAKLTFSSRAQIAAWVVTKGLLPPS